jgi:hypothetical protein
MRLNARQSVSRLTARTGAGGQLWLWNQAAARHRVLAGSGNDPEGILKPENR